MQAKFTDEIRDDNICPYNPDGFTKGKTYKMDQTTLYFNYTEPRFYPDARFGPNDEGDHLYVELYKFDFSQPAIRPIPRV